jgi:excisionase family DNA binding protein
MTNIEKGDLGSGSRIIGVRECAARLGCSVSTVYAACAAGSMQHRRLGGSVKFLFPDDIDAFVAAGVVKVS